MTDPIREYIRANMRRHTREAIREQLIAAGHDPSAVDAAWEQEWSRAREAELDDTARGVQLMAWLFLMAGLGIGGIGVLLMSGLGAGLRGDTISVPVLVVAFLLAYLGIGYLITRIAGWLVRSLRMGGWWSLLLTIALAPAYGALAYGTCLASYLAARR